MATDALTLKKFEYINKKVNGESGQKAAKELFYGFHDLKRKD